MFLWEKRTIQSQIEDSVLDNITFMQNSMDDEIENIKLLQYNLSGDSSLIQLVTQSEFLHKFEYYNLVNSVQQRLMIMKNSNTFINDIVVYIPRLGYSISTKRYSTYNESTFDDLLSSYVNAKYPLIINDAQLYAVSYYPVNIDNNDKPLYLVKVVLSNKKVNDFLGGFNKYSASATALYDYSSKNWIINQFDDSKNEEDFKVEEVVSSEGENLSNIAAIDGEKYYISSIYSKYLNTALVQYVPLGNLFSVPDSYGIFLWIYAATSIVIMIVYGGITYKFVKYPITSLLKEFKKVEQGNLKASIDIKAASEFKSLFEGFNKMVVRLNNLIEKVYKQELFAKKAELKQLQSQINPHFLYNSYFLLNWMIKDREMESAEALSSYLGEYFQYITRNASEDVELYKEVEHARNYTQIQQMRFDKHLSVKFHDIPDNFKNFTVPRLILQPVFENSIEHGFKSKMKDGLICISFTEKDSGLIISVEDNGTGLSDEQLKALQSKLEFVNDGEEVTGIINVHKRITLKYGQGNGIKVYRSGLGGLKVDLIILPVQDNFIVNGADKNV